MASTSTMEYYHYNQQGSLLEVYDGKSNKRLLSQAWSPWGERQVLHAAGSGNRNAVSHLLARGLPVHMGYTGHKELLATGLTFAGDTRLYDARLKRFLNSDDRTTGGVRGQNRYSYAYNNPMTFIDPDGRSPRRNRGHVINTLSALLSGLSIDRSNHNMIDYAGPFAGFTDALRQKIAAATIIQAYVHKSHQAYVHKSRSRIQFMRQRSYNIFVKNVQKLRDEALLVHSNSDELSNVRYFTSEIWMFPNHPYVDFSKFVEYEQFIINQVRASWRTSAFLLKDITEIMNKVVVQIEYFLSVNEDVNRGIRQVANHVNNGFHFNNWDLPPANVTAADLRRLNNSITNRNKQHLACKMGLAASNAVQQVNSHTWMQALENCPGFTRATENLANYRPMGFSVLPPVAPDIRYNE